MKKYLGFTMVELLISIVVISIISVVVGKIMIQGFRSYQTYQNANDIDVQALIALEMLTNDIHTIRSTADITTATASSLAFVNTSGTTVTYSLSSSQLQRNGVNLANGVSGLSFAYLDSAGVTTSTASLVRYITTTLTMTQGNLSMGFTTLVGTRGLE